MTALENERDDAVTVAQVLAGNREAYGDLLGRFFPSVLRLCGRLLGDLVEAQDVAQEAILQAYLGLGRLQQPDRFGAWLHAIAANLARSALRRRKRPLPLEALDAPAPSDLQRPLVLPTVEQVVTLRETHDTIVAALMELSDVNREAVVGYYLQGYSYTELANLLGVPVSTVKSRLFKSRHQLRERLDHLRPSKPVEKETAMPSAELVPMQIELIHEYTVAQRSVILLRTEAGDRYLPLRMRADESLAVERALKDEPAPAVVGAQDTLLQVVAALGGQVEQIIVRSLAEQNYYATVIVARGTVRHELDMRLVDALVLAVRAPLPILVAPDLLAAAGLAFEPLDAVPASAVPGRLPPDVKAALTGEWHGAFHEEVLAFLMRLLFGTRGPHDLARLHGFAWDEHITAQEVQWEGQTMQAVRLPAMDSAWLILDPHHWADITDMVEWVQWREAQPARPPRDVAPPAPERLRRVDEYLAQAWPELVAAGARVAALMGQDGRLVAWQSLDGEATALRMGRAAVRDLALARHMDALVALPWFHAAYETYEGGRDFYPTEAAGANLTWTAQSIMSDEWLFMIGFSHPADHEWGRAIKPLGQVQAGVEALLTA
jgi:RNA polymerase sigma-70 factor (ECF subfamily)